MDIQFSNLDVESSSLNLTIDNWRISDGASWGVFNCEGDVGDLLAERLVNHNRYVENCDDVGTITGLPSRIAQVSLSEQQRLLEIELANDDTDFLDRFDTGSSVELLIKQECSTSVQYQKLVEELDLVHLQQTGFRLLSSGETRRVMLARALAQQPDLLILHEPFAGLDIAHSESLDRFLQSLSSSTQLILVLSREEDIPSWLDGVALFNQGKLVEKMSGAQWSSHPVISQMVAQSKQQSSQIAGLIRQNLEPSSSGQTIFSITNGRVAYSDKVIFSGLDWQINQAEHWQIRGPNGCGKSTLLGLIFGDHPQCYCNNIVIFGQQRGSGESIWDIKKHMGVVSSALHLQYRVSCSVLHVVLSGFFDSIGLYQQPTRKQLETAKQWLELFQMHHLANVSFRKLDYSQQRLLLIARALVKQPKLLILDEPYQGLDYLGRRLVLNTLDIIAKENLSQLLYVSHYQQDQLPAINNYLDFVPQEDGQGYRIVISRS